MMMKRFLCAFALTILWAVPSPADETKPLTVVELYTSQGCSSCPAADAFLRELAARDDILALSLHVDYWNYIGWKDPFSSSAHTARQKAYADRFHLRYVYTPQMIVHGAGQAVGSDRVAVMDLIEQNAKPPRVPFRAKTTHDGGIRVELPETSLKQPATLWIAAFDREHSTEVRRGENAGQTIVNANVVHELRPVLDWGGRPMSFTLGADQLPDNGDALALVMQGAGKGAVLGAVQISRSP